MTEAEWLTCDDLTRMLEFLRSRGATEHRLDSDRKLRLFACACWRSQPSQHGYWHEFTQAISEHEDIVDGKRLQYSPNALSWVSAAHDAQASLDTVLHDIRCQFVSPRKATTLLRCIFGNPFRQPVLQWDAHYDRPFSEKNDTLYQLASRRFAPQKIGEPYPDEEWIAMEGERWRDGTVTRLAQAIYDNRAWHDMPILGDALQEAGCENEDVLMHCRGFEREVCGRCDGDGKAHGADRPFGWSADVDYGKCVICKGIGLAPGWVRTNAPHSRGCWVVDCILGKS